MKKTLKQTKNALSFALVFTAVAYMNQYHWLENVLRFFTWFLVIQYQLLVVKARKEKLDGELDDLIKKLFKSYRAGEHFPAWLDNFIYLALVLFLVALGHWILAIAWIFIGSGDLSMRYMALKSKD